MSIVLYLFNGVMLDLVASFLPLALSNLALLMLHAAFSMDRCTCFHRRRMKAAADLRHAKNRWCINRGSRQRLLQHNHTGCSMNRI